MIRPAVAGRVSTAKSQLLPAVKPGPRPIVNRAPARPSRDAAPPIVDDVAVAQQRRAEPAGECLPRRKEAFRDRRQDRPAGNDGIGELGSQAVSFSFHLAELVDDHELHVGGDSATDGSGGIGKRRLVEPACR
jgi:hypothetical protein